MCKTGGHYRYDESVKASYRYDSWIAKTANEYAIEEGVPLSFYSSPRVYRSDENLGWFVFYQKLNTPHRAYQGGRFDVTDHLVLFVDEESGYVSGL